MVFRRAWASERQETRVAATLVGCALLLDALADGSDVIHGLGVVCRALALAFCVTVAVAGVGRFGDSPLALRFSLWRALGLLAAVGCVGFVLFVRWPLLLQPTDGGFALDVVGILWLLLTGSVWGRDSWRRLSPALDGTSPGAHPSGWGLRTSA